MTDVGHSSCKGRWRLILQRSWEIPTTLTAFGDIWKNDRNGILTFQWLCGIVFDYWFPHPLKRQEMYYQVGVEMVNRKNTSASFSLKAEKRTLIIIQVKSQRCSKGPNWSVTLGKIYSFIISSNYLLNQICQWIVLLVCSV